MIENVVILFQDKSPVFDIKVSKRQLSLFKLNLALKFPNQDPFLSLDFYSKAFNFYKSISYFI